MNELNCRFGTTIRRNPKEDILAGRRRTTTTAGGESKMSQGKYQYRGRRPHIDIRVETIAASVHSAQDFQTKVYKYQTFYNRSVGDVDAHIIYMHVAVLV